ncbi:hypothetical protein LCM17_22395 [Cereibacter sphaeroides]|nr:hypothetical protein [Cereibacter sphaeroides]
MTRLTLLSILVAFSTPALAQSPNTVWQYHRFVGASPLETSLFLVLGVPETDDMRAQGHCNIGANWIYADLLLDYDVSALNEGDSVEVEYAAPGYRMFHDATVVKQEEGTWGVQVAFALDDPIWSILQGPGPLSYQVPGGAEMALDLQGASGPVAGFISDCQQIDDLKP